MVIINQGKTIVEGEVKALLEKQSLNLEMHVDNEEVFEKTMHHFFSTLSFNKLYSNAYLIELEEDNRVLLIRKLVEEGCGVKSVISKRSLEDFFIKMTEK